YQFLVEKSQEDEPEKTNTKAELQSMVTVPIHHDTSSGGCKSSLGGKARQAREQDPPIGDSRLVVTTSVQHAMRAPLRAHFKDLPTSNMKEILLQRIEKLDADKAKERIKKKSKQDSPKTPPRSPPSPPPSGALGASGTT
ncbi:hypothetical protein Tco_1032796, partial [Tanacetum coccineum]